jgi:ABC-type glycerol-3-phosphate transport system substrate-binding protein
MNQKGFKLFGLLLIVSLLLMGLAAQCGPAPTPQIVEKVVTVEVEKPVEVEKVVTVEVEKEVEKIVTVEVTTEAQAAAPASGVNSADVAVEAAKQYAGTTLNVVWESGLQPQDPLTFAPKWEELTGIKVNVVEIAYVDLYTKQLQDHLTGGGAYDVITFAPAWLIDFRQPGCWNR